MRSSLLLPASFFTAGLVSRFILQHTETRWQILAFIALIGVMALAFRQITIVRAAASVVAATAGILIAKFSIEGWPI